MALSVADGEAMIEAAEKAGVCLMVGTMKRYDPAYERLVELLPGIRGDIRLAKVTTLESPSSRTWRTIRSFPRRLLHPM